VCYLCLGGREREREGGRERERERERKRERERGGWRGVKRCIHECYMSICIYIHTHTQGVAFYIYKYPRKGLNPIYVHINPKNGNKIFSMSPSQAQTKV